MFSFGLVAIAQDLVELSNRNCKIKWHGAFQLVKGPAPVSPAPAPARNHRPGKISVPPLSLHPKGRIHVLEVYKNPRKTLEKMLPNVVVVQYRLALSANCRSGGCGLESRPPRSVYFSAVAHFCAAFWAIQIPQFLPTNARILVRV